VHEAAHVQLNSLCSHEPLCFNAADEVFTSPLRTDARPMEGVIHANYVCAVLAELFLNISHSPHHAKSSEQARKIAQDHYQPLASQVSQIDDFAKLSTTGNEVFARLQAVVETCSELAVH
jgi:HEXXH motif-containing protein